MEQKQFPKTALNLDENVEATLCYALTWVSGIVFFLIEKDNRTVRFHAVQSAVTFLGLTIIQFVLVNIIRIYFLSWPIILLEVVLWIMLMVKAYNGEMFKLPVIGDFSENFLNQQSGARPANPPANQQAKAAPSAGGQKLFCSECGAQATNQDRFCQSCGKAIGAK